MWVRHFLPPTPTNLWYLTPQFLPEPRKPATKLLNELHRNRERIETGTELCMHDMYHSSPWFQFLFFMVIAHHYTDVD